MSKIETNSEVSKRVERKQKKVISAPETTCFIALYSENWRENEGNASLLFQCMMKNKSSFMSSAGGVLGLSTPLFFMSVS